MPVGWSGRSGSVVDVHVHPAHPGAGRPLLDAALAGTAGQATSLLVFDGDELLPRLADATGFAPDPAFVADVDQPSVHGMFHEALPGPPPAPDGYRISGLRSGQERARVEAHRAAWRPSTLPLPADVLQDVSPEATSSFTHEKFAAVQRAWLYDPALDLVVEAPDGSFAGGCTLWWDPILGIAEIEPLGVAPEHRRCGLATALCRTAAGLVGARGGTEVFINVGPYDSYPAPAATYDAAGFSLVRRATMWARPPSAATPTS